MFISQNLLIAALGYEAAKRETEARSRALWQGIEGRVAEFADRCDKKYTRGVECSGDILCERQGARHKAGCQGRTEPFSVYAKGLRSVQ